MIELRALGTKCNIGCLYCYQNPLRDTGNGNTKFDIELIKSKLEASGEPFVLWGGEPLLLAQPLLEEMLRFGYEKHGTNTILTNGVLINHNHISLFKAYNVRVIISCDGEEELNDARWNGSLKRTRESTQKTNDNIRWLVDEKIPLALNIQVTRTNSTPQRIEKMAHWLEKMDALGIYSARLHILEIDYGKTLGQYALDFEENVEAFIQYYLIEKRLKNLRFDLFAGIKNQLLANNLNNDCVWNACDPYTTESVKGMDGQGRLNNCGLTDKEGINFQKPDEQGYERYIALYYTPQDFGGCKDCRFFLICKGQCPGTALDGDWRNRSGNCPVWKRLFTQIEQDILSEGGSPISLHPNLKCLENELIANWAIGKNLSVIDLFN